LAQETSGRWESVAKLALLTCLIMPSTVLIHELAHLSIPLGLGLPAQLHPGSISGGAQIGKAPDGMVALQTGAGPLASLLMSLAGAVLWSRDKRRLWALAVAISSASRFVMSSLYLGARLLFLVEGRPYVAHPNFDEQNFAAALSVPTPPVALAATLYLFGLACWLLRNIEGRRRIPLALALVAGMAIGMTLWVTVAPPVLVTVPGR
jgi:hypothetical protein